MPSSIEARVVAALLVLHAGVGFSQEAGPAVGATGAEPAAAGAQYDVPPRLIRSWMTPYMRPKHGPKTPPDDNVVLEILIDVKGRVAQARIVKSLAFYDDAAIASVKAWLFSPALKNGEPVPVRQLTSIHFGKVVDREQVLLWDEQVAPSPSPANTVGASVSVPVPTTDPPKAVPTPVESRVAEPSAPTKAESPAAAPPASTATLLSPATGEVPRIDLLSLETQGADFAGWLAQFAAEVSRTWHGPKPGAPCEGQFEIVLERDGAVSSARIVKRSGNAPFDRAGLKAFFDSSYPALPKTYVSPRTTMLVKLSGGESASATATAR